MLPITYKRVEYGKTRFYVIPELGNAQLPSSTTILSVINKPALVPWAAKVTVAYIGQYLQRILAGEIKLEDLNINDILYGAKNAHEKIKKEAADIGSIAHDVISGFHVMELANKKHRYTVTECNDFLVSEAKKKIAEFKKKDPNVLIPDSSENCITRCLSSFVDWREQVHFEVLETETTVFSAKYRFAGTLDALGKIHDELSIVDYKSSSGIWTEYYYQVASYRCAWEEMNGKSVPKEWIIRFGKEDGAFESRILSDELGTYQDRLSGFFYARGLWNIQQILEAAEKLRKARVKQSDKIASLIPHPDIFGPNKNKIIEGCVLTTDGGETPAANKIPEKTKSKKSKVLF
ncbi:MAG: PD-(D/E)XK nuclease family protein [Caldisericia bacterium]